MEIKTFLYLSCGSDSKVPTRAAFIRGRRRVSWERAEQAVPGASSTPRKFVLMRELDASPFLPRPVYVRISPCCLDSGRNLCLRAGPSALEIQRMPIPTYLGFLFSDSPHTFRLAHEGWAACVRYGLMMLVLKPGRCEA